MREQFGTVSFLTARVWHVPGTKTGKENSKEVLRVAVFTSMGGREICTIP